METADAMTPAPTYGRSASSSRPWTVPSSPKVPWSTGKTTSIPGCAPGSGRIGLRAPLALLVDKVFDPLVSGGIERVHDGAGRTHGDFVLAAAAAINDGNS